MSDEMVSLHKFDMDITKEMQEWERARVLIPVSMVVYTICAMRKILPLSAYDFPTGHGYHIRFMRLGSL